MVWSSVDGSRSHPLDPESESQTTVPGDVLIPRFLLWLLTFVLSIASATIGQAAQPAVPKADQCLAELRGGQSKWIECYGAFETDGSVRAELSRQTFDMVRSAKCGGTIRVVRAALMNALARNGVLELEPQDVLCSITTRGDPEPQVSITLTVAPKVLFQAERIVDISPRLVSITNLPEFLVAPLRSAAESEFVRGQLAKGLNMYLEQAFPKR
jgi:hypothetical protein